MRFAILGAGATGGYLGALLARAGHDVTLIARGPHLAAMRERGVRVLEPDGSEIVARATCTDSLDVVSGADTVLITLKAHGLAAIAPELGRLAGPRTALVFAQNGIPWWYFAAEGRRLESVDPGGVIAAHIPLASTVGCIAYCATIVVEPGVIEHLEGSRASLAELDGSRSERVTAISAAMAKAGIKAPVVSRLRQEIWVKLLGNATLNPVSALTRATLGEMFGDPGTRELIRTLMLDVEAVGRAIGIEPEIGVDRRLEGAARMGGHKTSMLQDVEAGRPLEVEALLGSVVELAHDAGVPVPALEVVCQLNRQLDRSLRRVVL